MPADHGPEESAALLLEDWAATAKKKARKRAPRVSDGQLIALVDAVNEMLASGRWAEARPEHFVALVADLHYRVYGVVDSTLTPAKRGIAKTMAARMLDKEFGGDAIKMSEFLRWVWTRESGREKWRRQNGRDGKRLDWRGSFASYNLVDWKLSAHRAAAASTASA